MIFENKKNLCGVIQVGSGLILLRLNSATVFVETDLVNFRQNRNSTVLQEEVSRVTVPVQVPGHPGLDQ